MAILHGHVVCCRAAELKYGTLMELQKQLKAAETSLQHKAGSNGSRLLKEEVTEADIAEIISKWTGGVKNAKFIMKLHVASGAAFDHIHGKMGSCHIVPSGTLLCSRLCSIIHVCCIHEISGCCW